MKKIFADRGMGKTTSMLNYATNLALANPSKTIIFVTSSPAARELNEKELTNETPNLIFKSYAFLHSGSERGRKDTMVIIDDIDRFLLGLDVVGYTITIGEE